jgi:hypothetical protein
MSNRPIVGGNNNPPPPDALIIYEWGRIDNLFNALEESWLRDRLTRHEQLCEHINQWLANRVEGLGNKLSDLEVWLRYGK